LIEEDLIMSNLDSDVVTISVVKSGELEEFIIIDPKWNQDDINYVLDKVNVEK
jgi:hypothetical protein